MKYCPRCQRVFEDEVVYCLDDGSMLLPKSGQTEKFSPDRSEFEKQQDTIEASPLFSMFDKMFGRSLKNADKPRRPIYRFLILPAFYLLFKFMADFDAGLFETILAGILLAFIFYLRPKKTETKIIWAGAVLVFLIVAYAGLHDFNVSRVKEKLDANSARVSKEVSGGSVKNLAEITEVSLLIFPFDTTSEVGPIIRRSGLTEEMMNTAVEAALDEAGIRIVPWAQTEMVVHLYLWVNTWVSVEPVRSGRLRYALNVELTGPPHAGKQLMLWRREFQGSVKKENLKEKTIKDLDLILANFIDDYLRENSR